LHSLLSPSPGESISGRDENDSARPDGVEEFAGYIRVVHIRRRMVTKENMRKEDAYSEGGGGGEDKGEEGWRRMEEDGGGWRGE
jgi:hypothetical protein